MHVTLHSAFTQCSLGLTLWFSNTVSSFLWQKCGEQCQGKPGPLSLPLIYVCAVLVVSWEVARSCRSTKWGDADPGTSHLWMATLFSPHLWLCGGCVACGGDSSAPGTLGPSVSVLKPLPPPLQAQRRRTPSVSCLLQDLAQIALMQMTARPLRGDSWPPFSSLPGDLRSSCSVCRTHRVHGWTLISQPRPPCHVKSSDPSLASPPALALFRPHPL